VILKFRNAPAHALFVCAGVFVCSMLFGACEKGARISRKHDDRTLELTKDTIRLADGVSLHDVTVKSSSNADFSPTQVTARIGDVVRFTSGDNRTHALQLTTTDGQARATLDAAGQLRSPPLVSNGQAWVVSLKGLPAGTYTVSCVSHAGTATIQVQ
jgi:plastocyanin